VPSWIESGGERRLRAPKLRIDGAENGIRVHDELVGGDRQERPPDIA